MNTVYFDRLLKSANISSRSFKWDGAIVTEEDVNEYLKNGGTGTSEPYGDTYKHPVKESKDKLFHVSRVAWFVLHPEEITGIEVDNQVSYDSRYILPNAEIVDGWHRILAAKILGLEKVKIHYSERIDVLNYLRGNRKTEPTV